MKETFIFFIAILGFISCDNILKHSNSSTLDIQRDSMQVLLNLFEKDSFTYINLPVAIDKEFVYQGNVFFLKIEITS
jgi:hypothetical protein